MRYNSQIFDSGLLTKEPSILGVFPPPQENLKIEEVSNTSINVDHFLNLKT